MHVKPILMAANLSRKPDFVETRVAHPIQFRSPRRELEFCMDRTIGRPSRPFIRFLISFLILVPSALAQQPQSQPPTPTPAQAPAEKPKEGKDGQDKQTPD
jgi:hypothetical protein